MAKRKIIVFGIFDGVHDGHRDFFRQAKKYGDEFIVIVGRDKIAQRLKNKTPKYSEQERVNLVAKEELVDSVIDRALAQLNLETILPAWQGPQG